MQLSTIKRLAIDSPRENRFPLDAFLGMGIYSQPKTTGFVECVLIQFSHRWVNWESIRGGGNVSLAAGARWWGFAHRGSWRTWPEE
ncbi:hypothetical protein Pan181_49730 [Aeoliella mucimassa]|uniref:Uncharacterized protein n=1 Tax=Aeoliella mucimassa TaxID=2527972 RepID=A0A518AVJ1_9BACT|nr:hypothetical protein Pan181_49730 [Aeoliella mucimassa]